MFVTAVDLLDQIMLTWPSEGSVCRPLYLLVSLGQGMSLGKTDFSFMLFPLKEKCSSFDVTHIQNHIAR